MSDLDIYDIKALAEDRGITISFDNEGMNATQVDETVCEKFHRIEYELLFNLDMSLNDLMDVWIPVKTEEEDNLE